MTDKKNTLAYINAVTKWLDSIVINLNLCPFARAPRLKGRIHFDVLLSDNTDDIIPTLEAALAELQTQAWQTRETTLLIVPNMLEDFDDYLDALAICNWSLQQWGLAKTFQIASFHPNYVFEGNDVDEIDNFTNRSPYPIFHLLRQDSLNRGLKNFKDAEAIPEHNIKTLRGLNEKDIKQLFHYLFA